MNVLRRDLKLTLTVVRPTVVVVVVVVCVVLVVVAVVAVVAASAVGTGLAVKTF